MKIFVKKDRLEENMTILQLSLASGISEAHISYIENGERTPTIDVMCKLAKGLNRPITDLFSCD